MNKKLKIGINVTVILLALGLVLYFSLKDNFSEIVQCIKKMDYRWFILGVIFLILYRVCTGLSSYLVVRLNGERVPLLKCIQINFIILFFHGVTPFAGGGQPMEVYYYHNEKIDLTKSTNIVLQNFMVYQTALILMGLIAVLYNNYFQIFADNSLIKKLVIIGFLIDVLVLLVTFIFSFCKRINQFICNTGINILGKLRIVKDVEKTREKVSGYLTNFHKNATILKQHKLEVVRLVCINILGLLCQYSIAYVVIYGLGYHDLNYFASIVTVAYVMMIGSFVPVPGGTGGLEYGYVYFFGYLISGGVLTASMLMWRLISYYFGIIIGALGLMAYRKKETV